MKVITTKDELNREFERLMNQYNEYYWAVAWASSQCPFFETLIANRDKIKKLVVGTDFYHTQPRFIKKLMDNSNVRFMPVNNGNRCFHPKVYLFINRVNEWECLVGSPNFTYPAFIKEQINGNVETAILFSSNSDTKNLLNDIKSLIEKYDDEAEIFDKRKLDDYVKNRKNYRKKNPDSPGKSNIMNMSWDEYYEKLLSESFHSYLKRIVILRYIRFLLAKSTNNLDTFERKCIAGVQLDAKEKKFLKTNPELKDLDFGYFGSAGGDGIFRNRIKETNSGILKSLNFIPEKGRILKSQFVDFCKTFNEALGDGKSRIATPTRLLAVKRPDFFVCVNGGNAKGIYDEFNIKQKYKMNMNRYWDELLPKIRKCEWYNSKEPNNDVEKEVWQRRVAFLDAIYYKP